MTIERVRLKKHLKVGPNEYSVGVYPNASHSKIPEDILNELHRGELVEILEQSQSSPPPVNGEISSAWRKTEETLAEEEETKEEPAKRAGGLVSRQR